MDSIPRDCTWVFSFRKLRQNKTTNAAAVAKKRRRENFLIAGALEGAIPGSGEEAISILDGRTTVVEVVSTG